MPIDTRHDPETHVLSQQILRALVASPDPEECALGLLEISQSVSGANSCGFVIFGAQAKCISRDTDSCDQYIEALQSFAAHLPPGIYF